MYTNSKNPFAGADVELPETTVQPNPVDINDFCKGQVVADASYSGLKPSLKPIKRANLFNSVRKKKESPRELDLEALEANNKKIIYIRTFNHVKNEAIVSYPETNPAKTFPIASDVLKNYKYGSRGKKKGSKLFDSNINLSFFQMNRKKFNPLKPIKKKKPVISNKVDDDDSNLKDFAFLTGVNIPEAQAARQEEEEISEEEEEQDEKEHHDKYNGFKEVSSIDEEPRENHFQEAESRASNKESNNLPTLKKSTYFKSDKPFISVSEFLKARYLNHLNKKPKIYITAKTNSVQAFGRPLNYQDHLMRVYNKESTPTVSYPLVDHLGPKKDIRKAILESYLAHYNLEALKEIDENLYEYAKQRVAL